ncbi:MAG: hypothetical protein RMY34_30885 [Aulosira sp. DedQUE10]|nr:hypothetical protein [Aulosira sp. DedQUE10]
MCIGSQDSYSPHQPLRYATESLRVAGFGVSAKKEHEKYIPEIAIAHWETN